MAPWAKSEIEHERIERLGGHAGPDLVHEQVERLGHELAGLLHAGKGLRPMQLDLGVTRLGAGEFEVRHRARYGIE